MGANTMATYAKLSDSDTPVNTPRVPSAQESGDQVEIKLDLSGSVPEECGEEAKVINISVTNGGAVMATFQYTGQLEQEDIDVKDFKEDLESRLAKLDEGLKLRMLIYRGQILQNGKKLCDYKINDGDTLQLLTWVPEAAAAVAAAETAAATHDSEESVSPQTILARANFGGFDQQRALTLATPTTAQGTFLQEEVERWSARVKVWTCMLMLIYSFKLLVGMSQSLEAHHRQHSSELAFSFLGFWVAYVGLRAATRLNYSLARGYYYGQMTVAMCNLFLMAIRDPSVTGESEHVQVSSNVLYVSFAINVVFWSYIVYGAYRFQHALWVWLQDGAPEHVMEAQEDV